MGQDCAHSKELSGTICQQPEPKKAWTRQVLSAGLSCILPGSDLVGLGCDLRSCLPNQPGVMLVLPLGDHSRASGFRAIGVTQKWIGITALTLN